MTQFIYKVASRGEGKTAWLLEQARNEISMGENVVRLESKDYFLPSHKVFCEKYYTMFHEICGVTTMCNIREVPHNSVILIDDLMSLNWSIKELSKLDGLAKRVYITLNGISASTEDTKISKDLDQVTFFDN